MKIEIEKKITIQPDNGAVDIVFIEIISADSPDLATSLEMVQVGDVKMNSEASKALVLAISDIIKTKSTV